MTKLGVSALVVAVCALCACEEAEQRSADFVPYTLDHDAGTNEPPVFESDAGTSDSATPVVKSDAAALEQDGGALVVADAGQSDAAPPVVVPPVPVEPAPQCTSIFYRDADADGFGDPATALVSCTQPDGYVTDKTDCYDANAKAKPGQTGRSSAHRGDGSFDFNCDGIETPRVSKVAECPEFTAHEQSCAPPAWLEAGRQDCDYDAASARWRELREGWWQGVPACGQTALWGLVIEWTKEEGYWCEAPTLTRQVQTCL